jgi:hypothetical protein
MANLYFPQLSSCAMAQYPVRKSRVIRSLKNELPDGTMLLAADPGSERLYWQLSYVDLTTDEVKALQSHFDACSGRVKSFGFIDPTDNMLSSSADFTGSVWRASNSLSIISGATDPLGGSSAFRIVNNSGATAEILQTLNVPAQYQYCFSVYAQSAQAGSVTLIRRGSSDEHADTRGVGSNWTRIVSSGKLSDAATQFSAVISIAAGQSVTLFGPQLGAQIAPSTYRQTFQSGGVYPNAHWAIDEFIITTESPNLFSTSFSIETSL